MSPLRGGWAQVGWTDPAPGDPGAVRQLATRFQSRADDVRALNVELTQGIVGLEAWQGTAADSFRTAHQHLRRGLDEFVVEYERCVDGLTSYAAKLDGLQHNASALLPRVLAAQRRANDPQMPGLSPESLLAFAEGQAKARGELFFLRGRHDAIESEHRSAVNACIGALAGSDGSTALGRMFGDVKDVLGAAGHRISQIDDDVETFLDENANAIYRFSDVLGDVAWMFDVAGLVTDIVPTDPRIKVAIAAGAVGFGWLAYQGHALAQRHGARASKQEIDEEWRTWKTGTTLTAAGLVLPEGSPAAMTVTGLEAAMIVKEAPEKWGHVQQYWKPKDADQMAKYGMALLGPSAAGPALAVPFWNAVEAGHKEDLEARAARETAGAR